MVDEYTAIKPFYKSVAAALVFCAILGPVGLLYATFWGGLVMIVIGIVVVSSKLLFPILLLWIICCIWGVGAVEKHNRSLHKAYVKGNLIT